MIAALVVVAVLVAGSQLPDPDSAPAQAGAGAATVATAGSPSPDATSLYNSVAAEFTPLYERLQGFRLRLDADSCEEDAATYDCELDGKFGILNGSELWGYKVTMTGERCWKATTYHPFGGFQDDIDAYRDRSWTAGTRRETAKTARAGRRLRHLSGCIDPATAPRAGQAGPQSLEGLAAQNVQREKPGRQRDARCRATGHETLGPDDWTFACTVALADGRRYIDELICFDPPPYTNYDACTEEDDFPRIPRRRVPG